LIVRAASPSVLVNIAQEVHGLQLGLMNIARNKSSFSVLPIAKFHR